MIQTENKKVAHVFLDENRPEESEKVINLLKNCNYFVFTMPAIGIVGPQLKVYGSTISGFNNIEKYMTKFCHLK